MQSNELRIGNLIYYNGNHNEIGVVSEIMKKDFAKVSPYKIGINNRVDIDYDIEKLKPIPITEEWLLKFGLKKTEYKSDIIYDSGHQNSTYIIIEKNYVSYFMWGAYLKSIKYVHELQNLYFALIGTELILKDK